LRWKLKGKRDDTGVHLRCKSIASDRPLASSRLVEAGSYDFDESPGV